MSETRRFITILRLNFLMIFHTLYTLLTRERGRGGLVVRSRPRGRRVPGSKSDSSEDPPLMGSLHGKLYVVAKCRPVGVVRKFGEGCQLRCRPRHLTEFENYKVSPKIALVFLQNGTLI
ncbi:hypothetical protein AVEN_43698-1 [Araneus ventricosus]|uniref:Uncharacterized protein n=1 Tax=Araneus ventricosus TaxID=182803 RepID=A0A4Y2BYI3_ARAVE|nr:hypothetical protein AVEN_43698-1 [Araneus ventricosus]